jgi:hypothetical protein
VKGFHNFQMKIVRVWVPGLNPTAVA